MMVPQFHVAIGPAEARCVPSLRWMLGCSWGKGNGHHEHVIRSSDVTCHSPCTLLIFVDFLLYSWIFVCFDWGVLLIEFCVFDWGVLLIEILCVWLGCFINWILCVWLGCFINWILCVWLGCFINWILRVWLGCFINWIFVCLTGVFY